MKNESISSILDAYCILVINHTLLLVYFGNISVIKINHINDIMHSLTLNMANPHELLELYILDTPCFTDAGKKLHPNQRKNTLLHSQMLYKTYIMQGRPKILSLSRCIQNIYFLNIHAVY